MKIWVQRWDRSSLGKPAAFDSLTFHSSEGEALSFCTGYAAGQREASPEAPDIFIYPDGVPHLSDVSSPLMSEGDIVRTLTAHRYFRLSTRNPEWESLKISRCNPTPPSV